MTVAELTEIIKNNNIDDTENSRKVFELEEGHQYKYKKRVWITKARGVKRATQKFHILSFLESKEAEEEYNELQLKNPALIIYLREVVNKEDMTEIANEICEVYKDRAKANKNYVINDDVVIEKAKQGWNGFSA